MHAGRTLAHARLLLLAAGALTALGGCGGSLHATSRAGRVSGANLKVPVAVRVGPAGGTTVVAPVYINGQGPFRFVVDTGASRSIIDQRLAQRLGFTIHSSHAVLTGVNAANAAGRITVKRWRIGGVGLPGGPVLTLALAGDKRGPRLGGLIGSDNLRRFGSFTLDYRNSALVLRPRG